jgi:hypothetical protein
MKSTPTCPIISFNTVNGVMAHYCGSNVREAILYSYDRGPLIMEWDEIEARAAAEAANPHKGKK